MKNLNCFFIISFVLPILVSIISCAPVTQLSYMEAERSAFTREIDEPAARGRLTRISPEEHNVVLRFALSPDEKHIVYSGVQYKGRDTIYNLWKISSDASSAPIKITSGGSSHFYYPSFTSDGNFIVYASGGQIWRVRNDGAGGKMRIPGLGHGNDTAPHVSINDKVVFNSVQSTVRTGGIDHNYLIWTSNLDGGELTQIREGTNPRWSPDGKRIVFEHDGDIWLINDNGTNLIQLTNTPDIIESLPSFSYDGSRIIFTSNENITKSLSSVWNIWSITIDGAEKTQITELNSWDSWPLWQETGIYFQSSRAQRKHNEYIQRIWRLRTDLE